MGKKNAQVWVGHAINVRQCLVCLQLLNIALICTSSILHFLMKAGFTHALSSAHTSVAFHWLKAAAAAPAHGGSVDDSHT